MKELIFQHSVYGGECPSCQSDETLYWVREVEVPNGYNDWQEWYSCQTCHHVWEDYSEQAIDTHLRMRGYDPDELVENMRKRLGEQRGGNPPSLDMGKDSP